MTKSIAVSPYFERADDRDGCPAESYVAGLRGARGSSVGVEFTLPAELVERAVLVNARLSISLSSDGRFSLDADGLGDETLDATSSAGGIDKQTLESVVTDCLDQELLAGDDDPLADLATLRAQLVRALAQLDEAAERMKGHRKPA